MDGGLRGAGSPRSIETIVLDCVCVCGGWGGWVGWVVGVGDLCRTVDDVCTKRRLGGELRVVNCHKCSGEGRRQVR